MKIIDAAPAVAPNTPTQPSQGQQSARERAIAKMMGSAPQAQESPVQNPSAVSPEEMGAITQPSDPTQDLSAEPGQNGNDESSQPAEPEATDGKEKQPLSAQFAQLARKEKAIRAQANEVKAKEADIAMREAALQKREAEVSSSPNLISKAKLLEDPIGVMAELGVTYDQLTQKALNAPSAEESAMLATIKKLEAKIEAIEGDAKGTKETIENRDKQAYQQAVASIRTETERLVASGDDFEAIRDTGSVDDVVSLIEETFNKDGYLMTVDEAAREVENELQEQILRLTKLKKIQSKLQAPAAPKPAAQQQAAAPAPKSPAPVKTLTNAMGAQPKMSARERAMLAFQGKLNK